MKLRFNANLGVRWVGVAEKIVCLRIKRTWCLHVFTHFPFCDCGCAMQVQKTPHIAMFRTFRWFFLVEFWVSCELWMGCVFLCSWVLQVIASMCACKEDTQKNRFSFLKLDWHISYDSLSENRVSVNPLVHYHILPLSLLKWPEFGDSPRNCMPSHFATSPQELHAGKPKDKPVQGTFGISTILYAIIIKNHAIIE